MGDRGRAGGRMLRAAGARAAGALARAGRRRGLGGRSCACSPPSLFPSSPSSTRDCRSHPLHGACAILQAQLGHVGL